MNKALFKAADAAKMAGATANEVRAYAKAGLVENTAIPGKKGATSTDYAVPASEISVINMLHRHPNEAETMMKHGNTIAQNFEQRIEAAEKSARSALEEAKVLRINLKENLDYVEELEKDNAQKASRISETEAMIAKCTKVITYKESEIENCNGQIATLNNAIADKEARISELEASATTQEGFYLPFDTPEENYAFLHGAAMSIKATMEKEKQNILQVADGFAEEPVEADYIPTKTRRKLPRKAVQAGDGIYYIRGKYHAKLRKAGDKWYMLAGSDVTPSASHCPETYRKMREEMMVENNKLLRKTEVSSPSAAASLVYGYSVNGWTAWTNRNGLPLDAYRQ